MNETLPLIKARQVVEIQIEILKTIKVLAIIISFIDHIAKFFNLLLNFN